MATPKPKDIQQDNNDFSETISILNELSTRSSDHGSSTVSQPEDLAGMMLLQLDMYKFSGNVKWLKPILRGVQLAAPDLMWAPRSADKGIAAFYDWDNKEPFTTDNAAQVIAEIQASKPNMDKLQPDQVMKIRETIIALNRCQDLPYSMLPHLLDECHPGFPVDLDLVVKLILDRAPQHSDSAISTAIWRVRNQNQAL